VYGTRTRGLMRDRHAI